MTNTFNGFITHELTKRYGGKTILSDIGQPFVVHFVRGYDDSPDPGFVIQFMPHYRSDDPTSAHPRRTISPMEALPEIWSEVVKS